FRASRHRRRMCPALPDVLVSRSQGSNRLWCCSEFRHVTRSHVVVGRSAVGRHYRGSSISGAAVARRPLLVDRARLVRTTSLSMEGLTGVTGSSRPFREGSRALETVVHGQACRVGASPIVGSSPFSLIEDQDGA